MINKNLLLECLRELADIDFQKEVWLNKDKEQASSFVELVCQTFDDTGLSDAIEEDCLIEEMGETLGQNLLQLDEAILKVNAKNPPDVLITSESMDQVRLLSKIAVQYLEKYIKE